MATAITLYGQQAWLLPRTTQKDKIKAIISLEKKTKKTPPNKGTLFFIAAPLRDSHYNQLLISCYVLPGLTLDHFMEEGWSILSLYIGQ